MHFLRKRKKLLGLYLGVDKASMSYSLSNSEHVGNVKRKLQETMSDKKLEVKEAAS